MFLSSRQAIRQAQPDMPCDAAGLKNSSLGFRVLRIRVEASLVLHQIWA